MNGNLKKIKAIVPPPAPHMVGDGFRVSNFFPSNELIGESGMSPFYLLDYNAKSELPPSEKPRGVGAHPHRGFEAVTICFHGRIAHHDSAGNSGVIAQGDVQWMTAGSGVLHKEYHETEFCRKGGTFQIAQVWVNLPARYKMVPPRYQAIEHINMGRFILDDKKSVVDIVAGEYNEIRGPAKTYTPVNMYIARLISGVNARFSFPEKYNTGILVVEGKADLNGREVLQDYFVYFENEGEKILAGAIDDCILLIMSGEPIEEPVASKGPFVMNTENELKMAYQDLRSGSFGNLND
jgi:redox-sensitive bicupin YhaK (pirin superfamily)